jgi:hypothetical protein
MPAPRRSTQHCRPLWSHCRARRGDRVEFVARGKPSLGLQEKIRIADGPGDAREAISWPARTAFQPRICCLRSTAPGHRFSLNSQCPLPDWRSRRGLLVRAASMSDACSKASGQLCQLRRGNSSQTGRSSSWAAPHPRRRFCNPSPFEPWARRTEHDAVEMTDRAGAADEISLDLRAAVRP